MTGNFDWQLIHRIAEEFSLWTTVVINAWLLTTAISFAVFRIRTSSETAVTQFVKSAQWGYLVTLSVINIGGCIFAITAMLHADVSFALKVAAVTVALSAAIFWEWLGVHVWRIRNSPRQNPRT
jgi:hypothetical protein